LNDLAALTPPFLVAAVVIIAITAFLRHEMGRKRADRADLGGNIRTTGPHVDDNRDTKRTDDAHAAAAPDDDA
jgi:hypothetical protein